MNRSVGRPDVGFRKRLPCLALFAILVGCSDQYADVGTISIEESKKKAAAAGIVRGGDGPRPKKGRRAPAPPSPEQRNQDGATHR
ncbi:hypothetical protein [Singulisphaera sp. PoT]|uniref:hypothetical protein n=1 Tax=Singulisphaera sp. PoT TaxID=3411797 RepID=UPI003BF5ADD2